MIDDYVFQAKYAKYIPSKQRRETWEEATDRLFEMHKTKAPQLTKELSEIECLVKQRSVVGSQRALQFAGDAILEKNMRIFNCCATHVDRPRVFSEILWLLLCGCGVGFSVQKHHVAKLPTIVEPSYPSKFVVEDTIEGWADAVNALFNAYMYGESQPYFDFSKIRARGSVLRHGGKAPGHEPLKLALDRIEDILRLNMGEKMTPLAVFDCIMHLADCPRSAGSRRSATLAEFSLDDKDMMTAKTGDWYIKNPQRARANISPVLLQNSEFEQFSDIFENTRQFGEPGLLFKASTEHTVNPCAEALMCPVLILKDGAVVENYTLDLLDPTKRDIHKKNGFEFHSGWSACNLTSINASTISSEEDFISRVRAATLLGTIQASYTDTGYLDRDSTIPVNRLIIEREALLGVSICGILDNPEICLNPDILRRGAETALKENEVFAGLLGIRKSSRLTCVKPEGTNSLVLGGIGSGIHPRRARRFIRRIQANSLDSVFQSFRAVNPTCVEKMVGPGYDDDSFCVCFPLESPENAVLQVGLDPIEHLRCVKLVQENWVAPATRQDRLEGAAHSVSVTVTVDEDKWGVVRDFVWENKEFFVGLSFLPSIGDYVFDYAPQQAVYPDARTEKERVAWLFWEQLRRDILPVDYTKFIETEDGTTVNENLACGLGGCDLI